MPAASERLLCASALQEEKLAAVRVAAAHAMAEARVAELTERS